MKEAPPAHSLKGPVVRLIFEYEGDQIKLINTQRTEMKIPRPIMQNFERTKAGFWVELEDDAQKPLCQCFIKNPLLKGVEVHSPDGTIAWKENPNPKGHFAVLMPDLEDARFISMHRSTAARKTNLAKAGPPKTLYRNEFPR